MRAVPFHFEGKGVFDVTAGISGVTYSKKEQNFGCYEPRTVLEHRRSPSPPTSTSTHSTSPANSDAGTRLREDWDSELPPIAPSFFMGPTGDWDSMLHENARNDDLSLLRWFDVEDLSFKQLMQSGGPSADFDSTAATATAASSNAFGVVDPGFSFDGPTPNATIKFSSNGNNVNSIANVKSAMFCGVNQMGLGFSSEGCGGGNSTSISTSNGQLLSMPTFYQETMADKPQLLNAQLIMNQQQQQQAHCNPNPTVVLPNLYTQQDQQQQQQQQQMIVPPLPKRHHAAILDPPFPHFTKPPFIDCNQELLLQRQQLHQGLYSNAQVIPKVVLPKTKLAIGGGDVAIQQQHSMVEQLVKVAELIEAGNLEHARGILARLNHQLPLAGKPLLRAAFCSKEALQLILSSTPTPLSSLTSPLDVVYKISAYKVFSDSFPYVQFTNFTCNQALLEALDGFNCIHIVDFDIGIGGQWASFMQELAVRLSGVQSLRITAFVSTTSHHPLELTLTRDNLTQFANDLNIAFEFNVITLDALDLSTALSLPFLNLSNNEAVAVNFAAGSLSPPAPMLLRLVKQLSPKIVVSVDHGCDHNEVSFSQHFVYTLKSHYLLFDSLDVVNMNSDAVGKIQRYLIQPRIEKAILGRYHAGEKMLTWRTLFTSVGFSPLVFSNLTETQAECMVRRLPGKGFHVEKRQASLYLCWQHGVLASVSAWRC